VAVGDYQEKHRAARARAVPNVDAGGANWGERWAACERCAALIEARDVLALVSRAIEALPASAVRGRKLVVARGHLIDTYEHLLGSLAPGRGRITADNPLGRWEGPTEDPA
jgi:hypothetical protein